MSFTQKKKTVLTEIIKNRDKENKTICEERQNLLRIEIIEQEKCVFYTEKYAVTV